MLQAFELLGSYAQYDDDNNRGSSIIGQVRFFGLNCIGSCAGW